MATIEEIAALRTLISDTDEPYTFTDGELEVAIDSLGMNASAAGFWRRKAAASSELVDVSESGSSRKLSDVSKNAIAMATYFDSQVAEETGGVRPTTRRIVRPEPLA